MHVLKQWPFSSSRRRVPVKRQLSFSPVAVPSTVLPVGAGFLVHWDADVAGACLSVSHVEEPERILWSSIPGTSFVSAAAGKESIRDKRGSVTVDDTLLQVYAHQTVEEVYGAKQGGQTIVVVRGTLFSEPTSKGRLERGLALGKRGSAQNRIDHGDGVAGVPYRLVFEEKQDHHLGFEVSVGDVRSDPVTTSTSASQASSDGADLSQLASQDLPAYPVGSTEIASASAEYVADWLAQSDVGFEGSQSEPSNLDFEGVDTVELLLESKVVNEEGSEAASEEAPFHGSTQSAPSATEFASSHSQWSADSCASDALSTRWWSLSVPASDGCIEAAGLEAPVSKSQLQVAATRQIPVVNRVQLTYATTPDERFFGFGEQFSHFDLKGKRIPTLVQEQGIGRGDQPVTFLANLASPGSGGTQFSSYAAVPHYITSHMRSLYLETYEYALFDLRDPHAAQVRVHAASMRGRILHGTTPAQLIERYTAAIGRMQPLPKWLTQGAVVGLQGGTARVREILSQLRESSVPLSGVWLQDWVGQRQTSIGWQLWWNWQLDREHYPDWEALREEIRQQGAHILGYVNPFLAKVDGPQKQHYGRDLFAEAASLGFLVRTSSGRPYMVQNTSFSTGLVDLTNPSAVVWLKQVIKQEMVALGINGWMADFGESLPFDAVLHSGEDPAIVHNRYPEMWAQLNREVVEEVEAERAADRSALLSSKGDQNGALSRIGLQPHKDSKVELPACHVSSIGSHSSSWASLPSTESGDLLGAKEGLQSPSQLCQSPDSFLVSGPDEGPEIVEPFDLDDCSAIEKTTIMTRDFLTEDFDKALATDVSTLAALDRHKQPGADKFGRLSDGSDESNADRAVFFMRAGYRSSPGHVSLFWLGDQMTSWQRHDGIKSAVTGMLSGGLSGFSLTHSDIGGYCSVSLPGLRIVRSEELLLRWMELSAFTLVFRTHEGNLPDAGVQAYSNGRTLAHFARMAKVYTAWDFYRQHLMQEASSTGLPVVRHLFLHYPHDPVVQSLVYEQFLVGDQILVAPVLDPNTTRVKVYLPGRQAWQHVWSGEVFVPSGSGEYFHIDAPLGLPAVFVREGSAVGVQFRKNLREHGLLADQ